MEDSGPSAADAARSPGKTSSKSIRTVRSRKIVADQPAEKKPKPIVEEDEDSEEEDEEEDDDDDEDESSSSSSSSEDEQRPPLPRSHTPGQLANKNKPPTSQPPPPPPPVPSSKAVAELALRHRSGSNTQQPQHAPPPRPATAPGHRKPPASVSAVPPLPPKDEKTTETKQPVAPAPTKPTSSTTASSSLSRASKPPPGKHIPFPPLQKPEDAPEVAPAPASGMYWSKAPVSGSPHASLRAHTTALVGSSIYIFGGCDAKTCFNVMYVLDADSFYWSVPYMAGDIPMPLRAMTCTAVGKKLVVFGGGDGPSYYNDVYVLDTVNFRWTKPRIVGDKIPSKRRAHTACLYKNGIYVFGGGDGVRALNDIWRLDVSDTSRMSWKLISNAEKPTPGSKDRRPKARGYHTANMVGSKLIIFGGSDGGECFDDVWVYDVDKHTWKPVNIPVTFRRLSHTATIVGSYLFVIGGHDGHEYCNDVLLLNLVTMTWDKRKVYGLPPSGRGYHGTVLYDSRLVVVGGFDGSEVFGDVLLLELAVHAYYSQISHFTIDI